MAINDLVGLLTGTSMTQQLPPITSNPQVNILNRMRANTQQITKAGRGVAGGVRGLLGLPPLPPSEEEKAQKLRQDLNALDLTNLDDLESLITMIAPYDPIRAATLATGVRNKRSSEADKITRELEEESQRKAFADYLKVAFPDEIGLDVLAESGVLTPDNFKQMMPMSGTNKQQFGGSDIFKDEQGSLFYGTQVKDPLTGETRTEFSSIGGSGGDPIGKVTQLKSSGETAVQEREGKVDAKLQEEYGKKRLNAIDNIPSLVASKDKLDKALDLLDSVSTGGPINLVAYGLSDFFGVTTADKAELEVILGQQMYKSLRPLFGGVISEGERTAIERIYANLGKGNTANRGILRALIKEIQDSISAGRLYLNNERYTDYNKEIKQLIPEKAKSTQKTIKFSDLT